MSKQVPSKLKNGSNTCFRADGDTAKEQKSKLDLISRQDAINACLNGWNKGYDEILTDIRTLPSADAVQIPIKLEKRYPQSRDEDITDAFMRGYLAGRSSADRPTGEWQDEHGKPMRWTSFAGYCSNCGEWSEYLTDYCGNCGAKMGGDTE